MFFADLTSAGIGDFVHLIGDEGRHAAQVRRLRQGEPVALTDGAGTLVRAVVRDVRRGEVDAEVLERVEVAAPALRLTVVQALARGGRDELAVEVMTEVGVDEVVGWQAARAVARWGERTGDKWLAAAHAATKQSGRAWLPRVSGPATTADVADRCTAADLAVVLDIGAERDLGTVVDESLLATGEVLVVVGPEGGITDEELDALRAAGAVVARLGDTVLRSSTAGVAALAVISARARWR